MSLASALGAKPFGGSAPVPTRGGEGGGEQRVGRAKDGRTLFIVCVLCVMVADVAAAAAAALLLL